MIKWYNYKIYTHNDKVVQLQDKYKQWQSGTITKFIHTMTKWHNYKIYTHNDKVVQLQDLYTQWQSGTITRKILALCRTDEYW